MAFSVLYASFGEDFTGDSICRLDGFLLGLFMSVHVGIDRCQ